MGIGNLARCCRDPLNGNEGRHVAHLLVVLGRQLVFQKLFELLDGFIIHGRILPHALSPIPVRSGLVFDRHADIALQLMARPKSARNSRKCRRRASLSAASPCGDDVGQDVLGPADGGSIMTDTPQLLLAHHLKALKLPTFLREYDKLARQCAAEGLDHTRYLLRLAELELIDRERRMVERRIKEARFPAGKSLDSFDFAAIPSLNKTLVLELARSEYVTRRENIIAVGNSGTGKTHIGLGLGLAACQKGLSV